MKNLWKNDKIQFARLLCEINANCEIDLEKLASEMDLDVGEVGELFDRAMIVFEKSKKEIFK